MSGYALEECLRQYHTIMAINGLAMIPGRYPGRPLFTAALLSKMRRPVKSFLTRRLSGRLALGLVANVLLLCSYRWIAGKTGNPRADSLRHLFVGLLSLGALVAAWQLVRHHTGHEKAWGIVLMVLPTLFLVAVLLWAAFHW